MNVARDHSVFQPNDVTDRAPVRFLVTPSDKLAPPVIHHADFFVRAKENAVVCDRLDRNQAVPNSHKVLHNGLTSVVNNVYSFPDRNR